MHGSSHQSDEELREMIGRGQFAVLDDESQARVPLQSFREVHRVYRTFTAFPDAILHGLVYHCIVCGSSVRRGIGDGCLKCWRNSVAGLEGSNVVYALPNTVVLPATRTAPAISALRAEDSQSSHGSCGDSRMTAGAERSARTALDQHGMYAVACSHVCGQAAIEMGEPESISGHVTLALLLCFMFGALFVGCDVTCIARRHVLSCGKKHPEIGGKLIGPALLALCGRRPECFDGAAPVDGSLPDVCAGAFDADGDGASKALASYESEFHGDLTKSVVLSVDGDFAKFVLQLTASVEGSDDFLASDAPDRFPVRAHPTGTAPSATARPTDTAPARPTGAAPAPSAPVPSAPAHPSEYDLAHCVVRLWHRILRGEITLEAAVPEFHAYVHACRRYLSRIPGGGAGHEVSEWLNAQVLSRLAPFGRMLTSENWRLFFNSALALHNHRKSLDVAYELLAFYVRATLKLQSRDDDFKRLREEYRRVHKGANVSDVYFAGQSSLARRLAAKSGSVPVSATDSYMNQLVRLNRMALVADTLTAIKAQVETFADVADKHAVAIVLVADSGLNLPSVSSVEELDAKIASYTEARDRLQHAMPDSRPAGSDSAIEMYLINLHALAADIAVHNWKIDEHRATHGGKNTSSEALYAARKVTVVKLARCLASLKRLTPHSPHADVRRWRVPDIDSIQGPESLPSCLGPITVTTGDSLRIHVIEAFDKRRAAREELNYVNEDIFDRVSRNIEAVISQLSVMLDSLTGSNPDIGVGAGASGLWGGMQGALFDFSTLQPTVTPAQEKYLAAGMACRVAEGLRMWKQQQAQVALLQAGIQALRVHEGGYALMKKDALSRALAMRHGRAMLAGHLSSRDWAALAEGRSVEPRRRPPVIHISSRAVAELALQSPGDDSDDTRGVETEESGRLDTDDDVKHHVVDEVDSSDHGAEQGSDAEGELDRMCREVLSNPAFRPGSKKRRAA